MYKYLEQTGQRGETSHCPITLTDCTPEMEEYLNFDRNDCLYLTNPLEEAIYEYDETSKDDGWMYDHITYIEYETTPERRQRLLLEELLNRLRDMRIFLRSSAHHFENIAHSSSNKLPTVKNNILFGIQ